MLTTIMHGIVVVEEKMKPTPEQIEIKKLFGHVTRPDMVINAGAGSGKTTTLVMLGKELMETRPASVAFYVTLNKRNAEEVREKFAKAYGGYNVVARTMHSLAFTELVKNPNTQFIAAKLSASTDSRANHADLAKMFIGGKVFIYDSLVTGEEESISGVELYHLTREMVNNFCKSADEGFTYEHTPHHPGIGNYPSSVDRKRLYAFIKPIAENMWDDICDPQGVLRFTHDHYLKIFQLSKPTIGSPGDVILYDEAQDAKPAIMDIVMRQKHMQRVFCGDTYQAIYQFTGAVNALRKLSGIDGVQSKDLTTSFRFGPVAAHAANNILSYANREPMELVGNVGLPTDVQAYDGDFGVVDAVITRSNAEMVSILAQALDRGMKPHAVMDTTIVTNVCQDMKKMMDGKKPTKVVELKEVGTLSSLMDVLDTESNTGKSILDSSALYKVVLKHGPDAVMTMMESTVSESKADIVLSTVHKAKGREWDRVAVYWPGLSYFPRMYKDEPVNKYGDLFYTHQLAEIMLLYVAVTRGRLMTYIPQQLARIVGISVTNAELWESTWEVHDLMDYINSSGALQPRRNGQVIGVCKEWEEILSTHIGKLSEEDAVAYVSMLGGKENPIVDIENMKVSELSF